MGCHCWIYKKARTLDCKQKNTIIERLKESVEIRQSLNKTFEEYSDNMLPFYKEEVEKYDEDLKAGNIKFETKKQEKELKSLMKEWRSLTDIENLRKEYETQVNNMKYLLSKLYSDSIDDTYSWILEHFNDKEYDINFNISHETVKGELYLYIGGDEWFRVYGYPEEHFKKKSKLLNWLKKQEPESIGYYSNGNFLTGYTSELVNRINQLFEENGEDNLFIDFG